MKRLVIVVVAVLTLAAFPTQALGLPGIDPANAPSRFQISVRDLHDRETYERLAFARASGWDFGDRAGYGCAWVEYQVGGRIQFRVDFELVVGPEYQAGSLQVNDKNGLEGPDGAATCGTGSRGGANLVQDGSPFVPGVGATFTVYRNGAWLTSYSFPAVSAANADSFWSVGNDLGEAYLWHQEPGESPVPVLRATVTPLAAGVSLTAPA